MQYFEKLSVDCNSKQFWKACTSYFSNKNDYIQENIMLLEIDKLLSKQKDIAAIFSKHFGSITDSLNLFSGPKIFQYHQGNTQLTPLVKHLPFIEV